MFIPETSLIVGAGKEGVMYVLDTNDMGHYSPTDSDIVQEFQATHSFFGSPLAWSGAGAIRLYVWGMGDPLKEFVYSGGMFDATPLATSTAATPFVQDEDPCGVLALSTNGDTPGTAILWATHPTESPDQQTSPGVFHAYNPVTLNEPGARPSKGSPSS